MISIKKITITLSVILITAFSMMAQIEKVIVEKYYISDANDATDTTGGHLSAGSLTYRVFIDLKAGSKLLGIYGDNNHRLYFESDSSFFNNANDGVTFANEQRVSRLTKNTVALDSWLTLGQVSSRFLPPQKTLFGIPKTSDMDGSIVGGANNNGGSAKIAGGLLVNNASDAGSALTVTDGIVGMDSIPSGWRITGFVVYDSVNSEMVDSTIFGSIEKRKIFESYDCGLFNSGVVGANADSNQVLVAQLTTKGDLKFELNVEVEEPNEYGTSTEIMRYVAIDNGKLLENERLSPYLRYPLECGCKNPNYLEYSDRFGCNDQTMCVTPIVLGCLDPMACNYNPKANKHLEKLCCYPGYCNDRDLTSVCTDLNDKPKVYIYPNPTTSLMKISVETIKEQQVTYTITNSVGDVLLQKNMGVVSESYLEQVNTEQLNQGVYTIEIIIGDFAEHKQFVKQ